MKRGFLKTHWPTVLITGVAIGGGIITFSLGPIAFGVIFAAILVRTYLNYDYDENQHNTWWNQLNKVDKAEIYRSRKE